MTQVEIEEMFDTYGCSHLYKKLQFPLWLTGEMDEVDLEIVEEFFESYEFDKVDTILVDDFLFQFRSFVKAYQSFLHE
ncbi:hypothetical protein ACLM5H_03835 [Fredinandcohnia humi]